MCFIDLTFANARNLHFVFKFIVVVAVCWLYRYRFNGSYVNVNNVKHKFSIFNPECSLLIEQNDNWFDKFFFCILPFFHHFWKCFRFLSISVQLFHFEFFRFNNAIDNMFNTFSASAFPIVQILCVGKRNQKFFLKKKIAVKWSISKRDEKITTAPDEL